MMTTNGRFLIRAALAILLQTPFLIHVSAVIDFNSTATKVACPSVLQTPTKLTGFSGGKLLVNPTSSEGDLCLLSRVDRANSKKIYIPVARSFDGFDWHRVEGKYVSFVTSVCGEAASSGSGYAAGDYLCQIDVPALLNENVGYFLTYHSNDEAITNRAKAARFLEKTTWGATWDEIIAMENLVASHGVKAFALWVQSQVALQPSSHRAFFRERLNPRAVESYLYGIPGPKACKENARFRRFAFTYKDLELSRGFSGGLPGNNGLPFTRMKIDTIALSGNTHYVIKFGEQIRTIQPFPLQYLENGVTMTLPNGEYTICHVEEVVGPMIGDITYDIQFQLLVGDVCTSSYTNRGGISDGKGDGAGGNENILVGSLPFRTYDKNMCDAKCEDKSKVKLILGGNPEVIIPSAFNKSVLSWIDLSGLSSVEIININSERSHDSSWLLQKDLDSCSDENGNEIPDPSRLAYIDYFSFGNGKYNLDKPIFARLPNNKWALHDFRTQFLENTLSNPLKDGGGAAMRAAARSGFNDDGNANTDLVVRCSNTQRNVFNERHCRISFSAEACVTVPLPDTSGNIIMRDPGSALDPVAKYTPSYAGPSNGGVVVCGSENEVAPIPTEDDHFDVTNRKVQSRPIDYDDQKRSVWLEVVLGASDQLCQKLAFGLSKIFATSTDSNTDATNTETNLGVYDNFVSSCFSTYRDVMKKVSFNQEMSEQLTFKNSKAVATDWHRSGKMAWPDENYARENLQLHSIGLVKLNDDGTPVLDRFGNTIANYEQKHIFTVSKIWTSFSESFRRGNYEDLDWTTSSYLDPLQIKDVEERDWFPKIDLTGGYIGDKYPLCSDLPERSFLRKGASFRLLGGSSMPLSHKDPSIWEGDNEVYRLSLEPESPLFQKLCNPKDSILPSSSLSPGTGTATYDGTVFAAPYCQGSSISCDSGTLLSGRTTELHSPNTLNGCADGTDTSAIYTESVKRVIVESVKGTNLRGGDLVKIKAAVIVASKYDRVDFYYASDASSPKWIFITVVAPLVGDTEVTVPFTTLPNVTFTLPQCASSTACRQAVRVVLRSSRYTLNPSESRPQSTDGSHKPTSNCSNGPFDDADDLVFEVLPSQRPQDMCNFETLVSIDSNLVCHGRECLLSEVRVVEVVPGVYYEYLRLPCVHLPFYENPVKVFAGWSNDLYMCADKKLPSARSTCCGVYSTRDLSNPDWADVLSEYRGERLTYAGNMARCSAWGRTTCDPQRIGPFSMQAGHCLYHQSCRDVESSSSYLTRNAYHWTTSKCTIGVKVNADGLISIVHAPEDKWTSWGSTKFPQVQSHVHENKGVSFFYVQWNTTNVPVGKREFPNVVDNSCDGGTVIGELCLCNATLDESAVFTSIPSRDAVLSELNVGGFDPSLFDNGNYNVVFETSDVNGVSVYKKSGYQDYSEHTIFRAKDPYSSGYVFLKNVKSVVKLCNGTFTFRNPPSFFDIVDPQLISAYQETDAYLDYVDRHANTPPFVCKSLLKHFGHSNPSPQHVKSCSRAYQTGVYNWLNPNNAGDTLSFGSARRGDLVAVAASILLHNDAISSTVDADPAAGGIKEPLLKLMQIMRGLEFSRSLSHRRTGGLITSYAQDAFGQAPYGIPDQFSYFSPDYSPAGAHRGSGLVSPESELLNMRYVIASQNSLYQLIHEGLSSCSGGIGPRWKKGVINICGKASDAVGYLNFTARGDSSLSTNVVGQLSAILTGDRLSAASRNLIESAYSVAFTSGGKQKALQVAQALIVSTPEFHVTNKMVPLDEDRTPTPPSPIDPTVPYKAIIHVNLFGGMDSMNMIVPHPDGCPNLYDNYKARRGQNLFLSVGELIKINASTSDQPCSSFGINSNLGQGFASIYNEGDSIFFTNIGHLQKPVTKFNFMAETKTQLFSHHTMKDESFKVDAFHQRFNTGILGRMTDILENNMATKRIALDGSSNNLIGDQSLGLKVDVVQSSGTLAFYENDVWNLKEAIFKLNSKTSETSSIHGDLWSQSLIDSQNNTESYRSMLASVSNSNIIPSGALGTQLQMILKLIKLRETRGVNRDTFAVNMNGFDQHFNLKSELNLKFSHIGPALKGFRDELVALGLWNSVTLVMTSEFGRTITPNTSEGTDHGWGGHHFMMGGQVKGGKVLGHHPDNYDSNWEYNTGRGVWIPTTPNEAMWFGIAQWFGLTSDIALSYVLPNMNNFGCRLYSDKDLYEGGTENIKGCGGDVMQFSQVFYLSEPRLFTPDEQKSFCSKVLAAVNALSIRCVILDQIIAARSVKQSRRSLTDLGYTLDIKYEISSDTSGVSATIENVVNSPQFKTEASNAIGMEVEIKSAEVLSTPTKSPTLSPTESPTQRPTHAVTYSPTSRNPTYAPSKYPTKTPFSISSPTSRPSHSPTNSPTLPITFRPSQAPTKSPTTSSVTVSPSHPPSKSTTSSSGFPTKSPSSSPTVSPSHTPSKSSPIVTSHSPSKHPTSYSTANPSHSPSKSPIEIISSNPTHSPTISINVPLTKIPSQTPTQLPKTSLPVTHSPTSIYWYPNWSNGSNECINDGNAPDFMQSGGYLEDSQEKCCQRWFDWDPYCAGIPTASTKFYPDWLGEEDTCKNDGKAPAYMLKNSNWLHDTLESCCEKYFSWKYNDCLGATATGSNSWYMNWSEEKCVQDCIVGTSSCGGLANLWDVLYNTQKDCCDKMAWWNTDCIN